MADELYLTITLRKIIETQEQGRALYDLVKEKMADHPEVKVSGGINNHFSDVE